jgi:hypothetical protein
MWLLWLQHDPVIPLVTASHKLVNQKTSADELSCASKVQQLAMLLDSYNRRYVQVTTPMLHLFFTNKSIFRSHSKRHNELQALDSLLRWHMAGKHRQLL